MKVEKTIQKKAAKERIMALFQQAKESPANAKKYIALARKTALRNRVKIPPQYKKLFCRNCNALFIYGKNCTIRKKEKYMTITCTECKATTRIPLTT